MECAKVNQLLSEYLDGTLDKEEEKLIAEHLLRCKNCSEEFESLKVCVNAIGSLEKVEAPEDFVQKVRERLHRRLFGNLVQKIFVPVRVKVPLELIGTAVAAVLVIYISNTMQPVKEIPVTSEETRLETVSGKSKGEAGKLALKKQKIAPALLAVKKLPAVALESNVELALLIKPRDFTMNELKEESAEDKLSVKKDIKSAETVGRRGKIAFVKDEEAGKLASSSSTLQCSDEIVPRITNIAESVKGRVLQVEREENTNLLRSVSVEVPLKNYGLFLEKLGRLGTIRKPLPPVKDKKGGLVNVMIKFEFGEGEDLKEG